MPTGTATACNFLLNMILDAFSMVFCQVVQAVMVHQLSKKATQNPFRKNKGRVVAVAFHPKQPLFFVASSNHVRVYNLVRHILSWSCKKPLP